MSNNKKTSPLIILDESPYHLAIFKPHGIASVGARGVIRPTLLDLVRERFGNNIFAVHRLDKVTAGIIIFAKGNFAKFALENAFKKRLVKKTYFALIEGRPAFKEKTIQTALEKQETYNKKGPVALQSIQEKGVMATTKFAVINQINDDYCLIKALPITGKMHQIRIHLSFLGFPIVGDTTYGAKTKLDKNTIALVATMIEFPLPKGSKRIIDASKYFNIKTYYKK